MSLSISSRRARWFDVWTCRPRFCDSIWAISSFMSCSKRHPSVPLPQNDMLRSGKARTFSWVLYSPIMRSILSSSASASSTCLTTPTTRSSDSMIAWIEAWRQYGGRRGSEPRWLEAEERRNANAPLRAP